MMPTVSIIIPCFNQGGYLAETLDSIAAQSFRDYEIVIVDDGSTDPRTLRFLDELARPGVRIERTVNRGVAAARNLGIEVATGRFILPLDADDLLGDRDVLARAVSVLESSPEVGLVYGGCRLFGEQQGDLHLPDYDPCRLLVENPVQSTALFHKRDWLTIGGYNEAMRYGWEDWDFWIAWSALHRRVVRLPEILLFYRVHHASRDRSLRFPRKFQMYLQMMRRNRKLFWRHAPYVILSLCRIHLWRGN